MSDGTREKLTLPPWHIPYLEKHNVYKLFYELARELVIQQPDDHVFFIKFLLTSAVKNIHIPHIIILGSPRINVLEVGRLIAEETLLFMITEQMVLEVLKKPSRYGIEPSEIIYGIQSIMNSNSNEIMKHGWLLIDCIKSKQEAQKLLDVGILPTHVLFLISPYSPKINELLYCNVSSSWPNYRRAISGIRQVFQKKLIEVYLDEFLIHNIVQKCVELITDETIENGPKKPRVILIGPRGCGRKVQAKMLQEKLNIIHVDFEYLLCQAWIAEDELTEELREFGNNVSLHPEVLTKVLNRRILAPDCLKQGWVLTGYPFNVNDFKYIDCLETPPNRVIFMECDLNVCFERISSRRVNAYTGSVTKINMDYDQISAKLLKLHPKDMNDIINAELQYYCTQYGPLRKYCGPTAALVNADQPERWVHESITAAIMRDLPITSPRDPFEGVNEEDIDLKSAMPYKFFIT